MTYLELGMDPVSGRLIFLNFPASLWNGYPVDASTLTLSSSANLLTSDLSILLQTVENSIVYLC